MSKTRKIVKWSLISIGTIVILLISFGFWFMGLIPKPIQSVAILEKTLPSELAYLTQNKIAKRGKILAVVTSTDVMGSSGKITGFELTELARAYYVFQANGFEVDVASPLGGAPPVVIDKGDMKEYDYAFMNDSIAQNKISQSLALSEIDPNLYSGVFFVGGKGAMFDFPDNPYLQSLIKDYLVNGKVVGAVCHGPAALVNIKLDNGESLLANRTISSFTNEEELLLIPDAKEIFPFLLQEKLTQNGAQFNKGNMYLNNVSVDQNLVTGQNPWSTWEVSEAVIKQLGYTPKERKITAEENSVKILNAYANKGYDSAKELIKNYATETNKPIDRELLAVHSIVSSMRYDVLSAIEIVQLLSYSNQFIDH